MEHDNRDNPNGTDEQFDRPTDRRVTPPVVPATISTSPGVLFGVLADARQRRILYFLVENGGTWTIEEIGKQLAAWENETTVDVTTEEMQNRVIAGMHHADVPKLDEYGFIEYDPETGQMTLTAQSEETVPMLKLAEQLEGEGFDAYLKQVSPEATRETVNPDDSQ